MFRNDSLERGLSSCSSVPRQRSPISIDGSIDISTDAAIGIAALPASLDLADTLPAYNDLDLACRQNDPELFFAESPADVELAKSLCQGCPVRTACLAGALERREPWGVWGGELVLQGVVVPRKRPRGRPRKSEIAA